MTGVQTCALPICDDLSGNAKDVCVKDAKAAHIKGKSDAKVSKVSATTGSANSERATDAKNDATNDQRQAMFKAANERCDALTGAPKDACQVDAKTKFGMK